MHDTAELPKQIYPTARVSGRKPLHFTYTPDAAARAQIAAAMDLLDLPELTLKGSLAPLPRGDVGLTAQLSAQVVQPCAITLAPVRTRLSEDLRRSYIRDYQDPSGEEVEITAEDNEPLPETIDVAAIAHEALALALPLYPRAKGASLEGAVFAPPGVAPLTDADLRPFAGLAALKLAKPAENG